MLDVKLLMLRRDTFIFLMTLSSFKICCYIKLNDRVFPTLRFFIFAFLNSFDWPWKAVKGPEKCGRICHRHSIFKHVCQVNQITTQPEKRDTDWAPISLLFPIQTNLLNKFSKKCTRVNFVMSYLDNRWVETLMSPFWEQQN